MIEGGNSLSGSIKINGAKNAALPIMAGALLGDSVSTLENIPYISDVENLGKIIKSFGVDVEWKDNGQLIINPHNINHFEAPYQLVRKIRASNLLIGPLLAKYGVAEIPLPGGCAIGTRPMDLHLKGFEALGATVSMEHGIVKVKADKLKGASIYLDFPSVGATENIMMAATLAEGITTIENVAKEPEIVDLANYLNALGAKVKGAGTDVIKITGVSQLHGVNHSIIPDRIEAGTYILIGAICCDDLRVENIIPKHLEALILKLREAGIQMEEGEDWIRIQRPESFKAIDIKTLPYPGFPTDLQPQIMTLMAMAQGTSIITENIFENRFMHVDELKRMGANIKVEGCCAIIEGEKMLKGASVHATDLRAGAALVMAALAAEGETYLSGVEYIERGYQSIIEKLVALGAKIKCIEGFEG